MKDINIFAKMLYNLHVKIIAIVFLLCSLYYYKLKFNLFVFLPAFILIFTLIIVEIIRINKESENLDIFVKNEKIKNVKTQTNSVLITSQEKSNLIKSESEIANEKSELKNEFMKKRILEIITTIMLTIIGFINLTYILNCLSKYETANMDNKYIESNHTSPFYFYSTNKIANCLEDNLCFSCNHIQICIYILSLCVFHQMEYLFVCKFHISSLSWDSFLINQSKEYVFTVTFSIFEHLLEWYFSFKFINPIIFLIGIVCMIIGHYFRISAEFTAGTNFTHIISTRKKAKHRLVKEGVYRFSRHPSYFGFYIWSLGTQIMCLNYISIFGFIYALNMFFKDRIAYEEEFLLMFFGDEYINYKMETPTLIPCKLIINSH